MSVEFNLVDSDIVYIALKCERRHGSFNILMKNSSLKNELNAYALKMRVDIAANGDIFLYIILT